MPTASEVADEAMLAEARNRGERLGFKGEFLNHFIENELRIQQKAANRQPERLV